MPDHNNQLQVVFEEGSDIFVAESEEAGRHIVINVDVDKNVNALKRRRAYIPDEVPTLGVRPVEELLAYLREARPPSGGYLLSAPKSVAQRTFRATRFTAMAQAFKRAFRRVYYKIHMLRLDKIPIFSLVILESWKTLCL